MIRLAERYTTVPGVRGVIVFVTAGSRVSNLALVRNLNMLETWAVNRVSGESYNETLLQLQGRCRVVWPGDRQQSVTPKKIPQDQTNSPDLTQDVPNSKPTHSCATKSLVPHAYAHTQGNKPSTCEHVDALQARDDRYLNPHHHTCRCKPPAKPTPEQTVALNKCHVAHKCYDEDYQDEVLIDMYKCMVCPLD